jgi:peptidoglycan/LPS O-acetylase OafA/YrhL
VTTKPYFAALDGLRAISVLLVISYHVKIRAQWLVHIPGQLGVEIFFVLSGYLITTLLLREEEANSTVDLFAFYIRRVFRIVPVYILILTVYLALCHHNPLKWSEFRHALPYYLTFTNELMPFGAPFGFSWTLGIEEKFYLVWPLLYFVLLKGRGRVVALPFLYVMLVVMLPYRMGRSYAGLLVGCMLAIFLSAQGMAALKRGLLRMPVLIPASLVIGSFYLVDRNFKYTFLFSWLIALLIAHLQLGNSWLGTALGAKWLTWAGRRSYGMYLVHGLVIDVVQSILKPTDSVRQIAVVVITYLGAAAVATPMLLFVEEPARRYGKALIDRRATQNAREREVSVVTAS